MVERRIRCAHRQLAFRNITRGLARRLELSMTLIARGFRQRFVAMKTERRPREFETFVGADLDCGSEGQRELEKCNLLPCNDPVEPVQLVARKAFRFRRAVVYPLNPIGATGLPG